MDGLPFRLNDALLFNIAQQNTKCSFTSVEGERSHLNQFVASDIVLFCGTEEESGHLLFSSP